jgi:hypothetical protein
MPETILDDDMYSENFDTSTLYEAKPLDVKTGSKDASTLPADRKKGWIKTPKFPRGWVGKQRETVQVHEETGTPTESGQSNDRLNTRNRLREWNDNLEQSLPIILRHFL